MSVDPNKELSQCERAALKNIADRSVRPFSPIGIAGILLERCATPDDFKNAPECAELRRSGNGSYLLVLEGMIQRKRWNTRPTEA